MPVPDRFTGPTLSLGATALLAGFGAWATDAVVDRVAAGDTSHRVALIPSPLMLVAAVAVAALLLAAVGVIAAWLVDASDRPRTLALVADRASPLRLAALAGVPLVPWLSDGVPVLLTLSGPLMGYVWTAILAAVVWPAGGDDKAWPPMTWPRVAVAGAVAGIGAMALLGRALLTSSTGETVWASPAVTTIAERLGPTLAGLAAIAIAATSLGRGWLDARRTTSDSAAARAAAIVVVSAPWLLNAGSISHGPLVGLLLLVALTIDESRRGNRVAGGCLALAPWLDPLVAPAAIVAAVFRAVRPSGGNPDRRSPAGSALVFGLAAVSAVASVAASHASVLQPGAMWERDIVHAVVVACLGPLTDRNVGLLVAAPAMGLSIVGLASLCGAEDRHERRLGIERSVLLGTLLFAVGYGRTWWDAPGPPGRALDALLPLLVAPIARGLDACRRHAGLEALASGLTVVTVVNTLLLLVAESGNLVGVARDGLGPLLAFISPAELLGQALPSFLKADWTTGAAATVVWTLAFAALVVVRRRRSITATGASRLANLTALTCAAAIAGHATSFASGPPTDGTSAMLAKQGEPIEAQAPNVAFGRRYRLPLLDGFDVRRRPVVAVFDPLRSGTRADVFEALAIPTVAVSSDREGSPPTYRVPFILPAGRYVVELVVKSGGGEMDGRVDLALGESGPPWQTWTASVTAPGAWARAFELPLAVDRLRIEVSGGLAAGEPSVRLRPTNVERPRGRTPDRPTVAASYRPFTLWFEQDHVWPEPAGFWIAGATHTTFTVVEPRRLGTNEGQPSALTFRMHGGPLANTVVLSAEGKGARVTLEPGVVQDVRLPRSTTGATKVDVHVLAAFTPALLTPGNDDRRPLGCWFELADAELGPPYPR